MGEDPYPDAPPTNYKGVDMENEPAAAVPGGGCQGYCAQWMRNTPDFDITELHTEGPCSDWPEGQAMNRIIEFLQREWSHLTVGNTCNVGCDCGVASMMPFADYSLTGEVTFPIEEGVIRARLKFNIETTFGTGECRYAKGMGLI